MLSPLHDRRSYTCPGEPGEISRPIHLARLAASYSKCRACPHRGESGALPLPAATAADTDPAKVPSRVQELVRTAQGFRGIYRNQLDRHEAIAWAAALASLLWDDDFVCHIPEFTEGAITESAPLATLRRSVPPRHAAVLSPHRRSAPTVVIGYDERPAAPDILTGIALGLQRMSCQVIDIGLATGPCLAFAVHHLSAEAGLYVTGAGCDPAGIGFDLRHRHGLPPEAQFLDRWQAARQQPVSRPSRSAGSLRAFPAAVPYEANLWKHFHALRPLQVVCGTTSPHVSARWERIFARLPGRCHAVRLPVRRRDLNNPHDADMLRVGDTVREQAAHLGVVMDDDGMACGFLDERGRLVEAAHINSLMMRHLLQEHGGGHVVINTDAWDELAPVATAHGGQPLLSAEADRAVRLMASEGLIAIGTDHRPWFGGDAPACDAIVTLAVVMQALSRSDAEFSQVLRTA